METNLKRVNNFTLDDIDGCEFVRSKYLGKCIISHHQNFDGYYTGDIRVAYPDGSWGKYPPDVAQEKLDTGEWTILREVADNE